MGNIINIYVKAYCTTKKKLGVKVILSFLLIEEISCPPIFFISQINGYCNSLADIHIPDIMQIILKHERHLGNKWLWHMLPMFLGCIMSV